MEAGNATSSNFRYNLPVLDQVEFETLHEFVLAIFDQSRIKTRPTLLTVSSVIEDCPKIHWDYVHYNSPLALSMESKGNPQEVHIWISPNFIFPYFKFYMTLVHELTHCYAGLAAYHGPQWRRWFYRTLWHLVKAGLMPTPEDDLKWVCLSVELEYNKGPKVDPMLTILEAFSKAEKEHDAVKENFMRRLTLA